MVTIALLEHAKKWADKAEMEKPDGLDWGLKTVRTDLRSHGDYRWPFPGRWAECAAVNPANIGPCPSREGDGLCVGLTWAGMAAGGIPARTLLLIGWDPEDALGQDGTKIRVRRAYVRDVIDGARLVREHGQGANLRGANLQGAYLFGAYLQGANLQEAYLQRANLCGANLQEAYLQEAYLQGAYLQGAYLQGAYLKGAYLKGANLQGANLQRAYLKGANLQGAYLKGAYLQGANLYGVSQDKFTVWP